MFRRRDTRSFAQAFAEALWPRGGWGRAVQNMKLRLRRMPGSPEEIARGVFAGVFVIFSPFFGLHFILGAILARLMNGRMLAAILATFVGNPLTFIPISLLSLRMGYFMIGLPLPHGIGRNISDQFAAAGRDLWHNFKAIFTSDRAEWDGLIEFWQVVYLPWIVGGIIPGVIAGLIGYYLTVPVIRAYQARKSARLQKKMEKLRAQSGVAGDRG